VGKNPFSINPEIKPFLQYFLPKGQALTRRNVTKIVKHFHLAFKGMETEEGLRRSDGTTTMSYLRGNRSQPLTSMATWSLIAVAIFACWAALASSGWFSSGTGRRRH